MSNSLVSIVLPIYNVEKYLDRCIRSVVDQTYHNLEIILVDDGSPDCCPVMCDEWAARDSRIKVIHKVNEGLGMARNTGIDYASGEYICFFDSDDYIAPDTVELAVSSAIKENADLVLFGSSTVDSEGEIVETEIPCPPQTVYTGEEICSELLVALCGPDLTTGKQINLTLSAWRVLLSMKVVRSTGWRFVSERRIISEDFYSMMNLYRYLNRVVIVRKALYFYCFNGSSLTHTYRPDRFERIRYFYEQCIALCKECHYSEKVVSACAIPFLNGYFSALKAEVMYCKNAESAVFSIRHMINDEVLQHVLWERRNDCFNTNKRIFFWLSRKKQYVLCYILLRLKLLISK